MDLFNAAVQQTYKAKWVVHCEPSLAGANHVFIYLRKYTHRIALNNQRILNIEGGKVTFIAIDERDSGATKQVKISMVLSSF